MKQVYESFRKTGRLHHAYAFLGDREKVRESLYGFLINDLQFCLTDNPDFWQGEFNVLKIEDSRMINVAHLNKPIKYERKIFVIFANFMTRGAQNSLLKIFEEPRADTIFFVVLPPATDLIPTLRSRMIFGYDSKNAVQDKLEIIAINFLKSKIGKRMEIVAEFLKEIKDEKKGKTDLLSFLRKLEDLIRAELNLLADKTKKNDFYFFIEELEKAISYANDESSSLKVILEHLALILPS